MKISLKEIKFFIMKRSIQTMTAKSKNNEKIKNKTGAYKSFKIKEILLKENLIFFIHIK